MFCVCLFVLLMYCCRFMVSVSVVDLNFLSVKSFSRIVFLCVYRLLFMLFMHS